MDVRRAIINAQDQFLPPEYQMCDYIECDGSAARINTGVPGNDETLVFEFIYMPMSQQNYKGHFGNYYDENTACWRVIQYISSSPYMYIFSTIAKKAGSSGSFSVQEPIVGLKTAFRLSYGKCEIVTEHGYERTVTQTFSEAPMSTSEICIGHVSNLNSSGATGTKGRFYKNFKIWGKGMLIRNYIPCYRKSDNKAGFYDTVNHTFNPSIGSAEFVAGNDAA